MLSIASGSEGSCKAGNSGSISLEVRDCPDRSSFPKLRDMDEGADIIMIKPALPYLDIIAEAREMAVNHPLACYQVSGEYAMVVAGANAGVYDLKEMAFETTGSMLRAGATLVLSYFTPQFLDWLDE